MREIRAATAQFEVRDGDKRYNLERIEALARDAAAQGAELVNFPEMCISGYTFTEDLTREGMFELAETIPHGPSTEALIEIARRTGITIAAGLVEKDGDRLHNAHIVVSGRDGFLARHRKLHEFISDHISVGDSYTVFDHLGVRWGILTCYDNNLPENTRLTAMLGAEVILAPHVTGCLPSPMPGRGTVAPEIWHNRERDPVRCRLEFDGPKGRGWLLRWLPTRAWENGVYILYANPIGVEGNTIKPGGSLILDPYGEVIAECRNLGDDVVTALLDPAKLESSSGRGYIRARRPELYAELLADNPHLGPDRRPDVWWKKARRERRPAGAPTAVTE